MKRQVKLLEIEVQNEIEKAKKEAPPIQQIDPKKQTLDEIEEILKQNIENVKA